MPKIWTDQQIENLTLFLNKGLSMRQIAEKLSFMYAEDFTRNAIVGKVSRLKLKLQNRPSEHKKAQRLKKIKDKLIKQAPQIIEKVDEEQFMGQHTLEELTSSQCRAMGQNGLFCGKEVYDGTSYCEYHHGRYYRETQPYRDSYYAKFK